VDAGFTDGHPVPRSGGRDRIASPPRWCTASAPQAKETQGVPEELVAAPFWAAE